MNSELVANLLEPAKEGTLPDDAAQQIALFMASGQFAAAWSSFLNDHMTAAATSSLYEGLRIAAVGELGEWSAVLIQPSRTTAMTTLSSGSYAITTPPSFNLVYVIEAPAGISLRRYRIANFPAKGDLPANLSATFVSEEPIATGSIFSLPAGEFASNLVGDVQSCKFLRFSGPDEFPFVYSFDPELLSLKCVSFADTAMTGEHFFIQLAKHILVCGIGDEDELAGLGDYVADLAIDPAINVVTRWKALQAAARNSKSNGIRVLEAMAQEDLPNLARLAQSQLA